MTRIERHPVQESPLGEDGKPLPLDKRVQLLEINLARAWDMIWWLSLSPEQRAEYEAQGFAAPIQKFYEEVEKLDGT